MKGSVVLLASLASLVTLAGALGGCAVHSVEEMPAVPVALPGSFSVPSAQAPAEQRRPDRWWRAFHDPVLDGLVDSALSDNLDLQRGWARLAQMRALERAADSGYYPQLNADMGVGRGRTVFDLGAPIGLRKVESSSFSVGIGAAYEVDLWGRISSQEQAAALDARATRQDIETLAMTLSARVADTYLALVGQRELLDLLTRQEAVSREFVALVELRFGQGLTQSALDVYQQRQQLAALQAQRPLAEARAAVLSHQLAVALGRAPGAIALGDARRLPELPPAPDVGLPSELLARRPDVRAALLRVVSADHRVGAAIASRYPAIKLSAHTGFKATDLADFFESWIWNLGANLVAPLFDGGRRSAEVARARARVTDLVHGYGAVVLQAFVEVEDALVREARQREQLAKVDEQLALARLGLKEARTRYVNGLSTYLNVLAALSGLQQVEQAQLAARRQLLSDRVQLYRALGGSWTTDLKPAADGAAHGE